MNWIELWKKCSSLFSKLKFNLFLTVTVNKDVQVLIFTDWIDYLVSFLSHCLNVLQGVNSAVNSSKCILHISKTPAGNLIVFYCFLTYLTSVNKKFHWILWFYHVTNIISGNVNQDLNSTNHLEFSCFTRIFGSSTFLEVFGIR